MTIILVRMNILGLGRRDKRRSVLLRTIYLPLQIHFSSFSFSSIVHGNHFPIILPQSIRKDMYIIIATIATLAAATPIIKGLKEFDIVGLPTGLTTKPRCLTNVCPKINAAQTIIMLNINFPV